MDAPSLEAFKARLDVALGRLVWWLATLHIAGGWNQMIIVVLFNPGHSVHLVVPDMSVLRKGLKKILRYVLKVIQFMFNTAYLL